MFARSDSGRFELVGPVRSVATKHLQLRTTHQFDRQGNLTQLELAPTNELDSTRYQVIRDEAWDVVEEQHSSLMARFPTGSSFAMESMSGAGRQHMAATEKWDLAHAEFSIYDDRGLLAEELTVTGQGGVPKRVCMMSVEA